MVNQSAPIQEVSRLLDLVPFLSTHSHISLKELAAEFGISEKAMANELTALSMCGLPGYTPYELIEIFFDSGFVTINNHDALDIPRALSQLEVASLLIGLEILRDACHDQDISLVTKIDQLLAQMKSLLGGAIEVDSNEETVFRTTIESAIAGRLSLELQYLSPLKDEITVRKVDPLSLQSERGHLYLVAFCHSAQAVRNFRVDRVTEIKTGGPSVMPTTDFVDQESSLATAEIKVLGEKRSIAEALGISDIAGDGRVALEIFSPEWISKAVIAHGPQIELLAPGELRESIKGAAENILALYSS